MGKLTEKVKEVRKEIDEDKRMKEFIKRLNRFEGIKPKEFTISKEAYMDRVRSIPLNRKRVRRPW